MTTRTLADGGGLYLQVKSGAASINKSWVFRYSLDGHEHWMGLGSYPDITLQRARAKAQGARRFLIDGHDPLTAKRHERASQLRHQTRQPIPTFDECRNAYVASHRAGWRSVRHHNEWLRSLNAHVTPVFGSTPVDRIDTALVCKALEPLWRTATETASRVRGRVEAVLNWAQTRGYRGMEPNPARWKGHLSNILPSRSKVAAVKHFSSMPYVEVPEFMNHLRKSDLTSAYAMQFLILTASRTSEVLGAKWEEIDLGTRTWTIPADRMKSKRQHKIPLSHEAILILERMQAIRTGVYVFSGQSRPMMAVTTLNARLFRTGRPYTVHGFRSSFRDWSAEMTAYPSEVAEMALAHVVGSQVENAYRRTDLFERRRRLMDDWATFCGSASADIVQLCA